MSWSFASRVAQPRAERAVAQNHVTYSYTLKPDCGRVFPHWNGQGRGGGDPRNPRKGRPGRGDVDRIWYAERCDSEKCDRCRSSRVRNRARGSDGSSRASECVPVRQKLVAVRGARFERTLRLYELHE